MHCFLFNQRVIICLVAVLLVSIGVKGICDTLYYTYGNKFCVGERQNKDSDVCEALPGAEGITSLTQSPSTGEFFAVITKIDDSDKYIWQFSATISDNLDSITFSEPIEIKKISATEGTELINTLRFSCDVNPILYGLSDAELEDQSLYEIDQTSGDVTQLLNWKDYMLSSQGLYYNIRRDTLFRVKGRTWIDNDYPFKTYEINPDNNYELTYIGSNEGEWDDNKGEMLFTSYFDNAHYITATKGGNKLFIASLSDNSFYNYDKIGNRQISPDGSDQLITDLMCQDYSSRCMNTFQQGEIFSNVNLNKEYEAFDAYIVKSDDSSNAGYLNCFGLSSCGLVTNIIQQYTSYIRCYGKRSCSGVDSITNPLERSTAQGFGMLSFANTKTIASIYHDTSSLIKNDIDCAGEATCIGLGKIGIYANSLRCYGLSSCRDITFKSRENYETNDFIVNRIDKIHGNGAMSLSDSIFYSTEDENNNNNIYTFYGWMSGYNSIIYCKSNHKCNVYCASNGCEGLKVFCETDSGIWTNDMKEIKKSGTCDLSVFCDESKNIPCPNKNYYYKSGSSVLGFLNTLENNGYLDEWFVDLMYEMYESSYDIEDYRDFATSTECTKECDDYLECGNKNELIDLSNDNVLCCRGHYSCKGSDITVADNVVVKCDAGYGCDGAKISGPETASINDYNRNMVFCRGGRGCESSTITDVGEIFASGLYSLRQANIYRSERVTCWGVESCSLSKFYDVKNIYIMGYQGAAVANIINKNLESFSVYSLSTYTAKRAWINIECNNDILVENGCTLYCYNEDTCNAFGTTDCNCRKVILSQSIDMPGGSSVSTHGGWVL